MDETQQKQFEEQGVIPLKKKEPIAEAPGDEMPPSTAGAQLFVKEEEAPAAKVEVVAEAPEDAVEVRQDWISPERRAQMTQAIGDKRNEEEEQLPDHVHATEESMSTATENGGPGETPVNTEKKSSKQAKSFTGNDSWGQFAGRHATRRGIDAIAVVGAGAALMGIGSIFKD